MKKLFTALALALATVSTPALAGPVAEATTSYNGHTADYGLGVGYQTGILQATVGAENFLETPTYTGTLGVNVAFLYGEGGILLRDSQTGYRLGAGANFDLSKHVYVRAGYQRDTYHGNHNDAVTAGLGVKF